jgi:hypothetical protein
MKINLVRIKNLKLNLANTVYHKILPKKSYPKIIS